MFDDAVQSSNNENAPDSVSIMFPVRSTTNNMTTNSSFTSTNIKRALLYNQDHYRVQSNPSSRATAGCWKVFGFPCVKKDDSIDEFTVIPGFASYKMCFETYKYIDSSTCNMNNHQCPKVAPSDQQTLNSFIKSPSRNNSKLIMKKKEDMKKLCVQWIANSMRPFQIVSDPGFKALLQLSMNIGNWLSFRTIQRTSTSSRS